MAAPTIVPVPVVVPHTVDLCAHIDMDFEGMFPWLACMFRPSNETESTNALGRPLHTPNGELFTLMLRTEGDDGQPNVAALQTIGTLMAGAEARVKAGEDFHSAMANEAYDLLAACAALSGLAEMREQLGVTVPSAFCPFPP